MKRNTKNSKNSQEQPSISKAQTEPIQPSSFGSEPEIVKQSSPLAATEGTVKSTGRTKRKSRRTANEPDAKALAGILRPTAGMLKDLGKLEIKIAVVPNLLTGKPEPVAIHIVLPMDKWTESMELKDAV